MADFLSNGVSALLAFQRALDVTSQNISNVGTDGYSRQRVNFVTKPAQKYGNGWVGSGVNIDTITRSYDDFLATQVRGSSSSLQRSDTFASLAARVDNMFGNTTTGLSATLQKFVSAVQDVANSPASAAPRQVLLSTAEAVASRLQQYDTQLATLDSEVESRLRTEVTDINSLAQGIAKLNGQIKDALANSGQPPNDLMDQRDNLLDQLSAHVNVSTSDAPGGVVNVSIGNGQSLVVGSRANTLDTKQDEFDPSRSHVVVQTSSGGIDVTTNLSGGTLGGLIDFRGQVLDPARNSIGRISIGITQVVNDQQNAGIDLNGARGAAMFAVGGVQTLPGSHNSAGAATIAVTRTDNSALTESDYLLQKTATGWSLRNSATGAAVTMTGAGTVADPFKADGLNIVVNGTTPATGDKYLIRPTRAATGGLNVLITNPAQIAAASPIKSQAATTNTGGATITSPTITDANNGQLATPVTISFVNATTYTTDGGATTHTFTSGSPITGNGWTTTISGTPAAGDTFTVSSNAGGTGDNSNALQLANAFDKKILTGGADSVNSAFNGFIGDIGVATQQAQNSRDAQKSVYADDIAARESVSGVNLDEEAANMLRYQQAYQAAAQLIGIAQTLFNTLIAATGGR